MRIVTTHLGADFDALGAMAGIRLLDPEVRLVFSGSQEAGVRRFLARERPALQELRLKQVRRAHLEAAWVADCSSLRRLGEVGELIVRSGCPVTVADHHPEPEDPIPGAQVLPSPPGGAGATCTVVSWELKRRGISPDPLTASLLLLGIYEDTGGLTYADTRPADAEMVAWLLGCGGRLEWVRAYVLRPLEPEQLELLNTLVAGAVEHHVAGVSVVVTVARPSELVEEAAFVVHRYAEIFALPLVVAILEVPPQLVVIVRSSHPRLHAGQLLLPLGGGGHATAAAARLKGKSAVEVAETILGLVRQRLGDGPRAGDLASPALFAVESSTSVREAKERLVRLRINAMPVLQEGEPVGLVTRQILDNAESHGLSERAVAAVMRPGVSVVNADTPLEDLERLFVEERERLVLVARPAGYGVITRMDLFRRLFERQARAFHSALPRLPGGKPSFHNVLARLRERVGEERLALLQRVGEVASRLDMRAYLVGGAVRDVLLGRVPEDMDVVVEGNGVEVARLVAADLGGRIHVHEPFLTAVITFPSGLRLDVATARTEFYRYPAALPEVERSALRLDLYRRDFTINAMAITLNPQGCGELVDFFGGQRDLEGKRIRVLHSLSFIEDPTRVVRAVRFATRLGFTLAPDTERLARVAVEEGVLARLSGERLRDEVFLLLDEEHPVEGLAELERLGVSKALFPELTWGRTTGRFLRQVEAILLWAAMERVYEGPKPLVFLAALALRGGERAGELLAQRLGLAGEGRQVVAKVWEGVEKLLAVAAGPSSPSRVVEVLERTPLPWALLTLVVATPSQRQVVRLALTDWARRPWPVRGADLVAQGVPEGPWIGHAVRAARAAVLDGAVSGEQALAYALSVCQELRREPGR
ncbi:MAG: CBS domain-containing protein [Thermoanaerobaculum sp.]|nr:CBS domain-containing protein [Thermoanaerobaculum sp.]